MGRIFLSHTEADVEAMEEIARGLEASGYATWYFERDVLPGASYLLQITRAIESSNAVVLIASEDALSSDQVTKEVVGAFERGVPFFPILIGITPPQLKERQPEWRHALGGTAMLTVGPGGITDTIASVTEGLKAIGIKPGGEKAPALEPVLSTPKTPTPKHISEKVLAARSMEGERKQVTVLFCDVVGFTPLSEKLDPEEVQDLIAPAVEIMTEEIHHYEGTIAQFLGDGLMALFGAPIAHEDAPIKAIHAALAIQERLASYAQELKTKGIPFAMRVGLNTGLVIVGRIGDDLTMEYTAIGDTVNLASRMESSAEPGTVQVAENTYHLAEGYFDFEGLGELEVKGKEKPVRSYRVLASRTPRTRVEASLPTGLSAFVGREMELSLLNHEYSQVNEGQAQVVGIMGEPGVGKSRLIYEFRQSLPEGEYTYLEGGCLHYGEAIAYLPILDILRNYFSVSEGEHEATAREKIDRKVATLEGQPDSILPPLCEVLSLEVDDEGYTRLEPQVRRQMVFDAIRQVLITESQNKPLIITIEDLHWIDKTSEEFLTYLIDSMATNRILLILLHRPDYTSLWTSKTYYSQVRVDQLPKKTGAELISSILAEGEVAQEITDLIVTKTAGNPLFIEELTYGLVENGSIIKDNEHYTLAGKPSEMQIPDTIQGIIAARLDRLEENLKRLMQMAAVIGREFAYRLLKELTKMQEELKSNLQYLQSLEFIYEKSLSPELEYIFKHALTQEVAYNSLLLKKRKELHRKIGEAIEQLYSDRLVEFYEMLAYHYAASDKAEKATRYLKHSALKSETNYANWEAVHFYQEAILMLDSQPEGIENKNEKMGIYLSMFNPLLLLGFPEGSRKIFQEAQELGEELGDNASLAAIYGQSSHYYGSKGDVSLAVYYSEKYFDIAERIGDIEAMATFTSNTYLSLFFTGHLQELASMSRRLLDLLEQQHIERDLFTGGRNVFALQCGWYGGALGLMGEFKDAKDAFEKGLKLASEVNDTWVSGWVEFWWSFISLIEGDADGTIDHGRKAIKHFEDIGMDILLGWGWSCIGSAYSLLGDHETAQANVEKGLDIQKRSGQTIMVPFIYASLALIRSARGDLEGGMDAAKEAMKLSREFGAKVTEAHALLVLGRIEGEEDPTQLDIAEQHVRQGISMAEEMKLKPQATQGHMFLGEVLILALRREEALESLKKAEAMGQDMGMGYWLTRTREALARMES